MTPTAMESGTIAEIDGWPGAMNMLVATHSTPQSPGRDPNPER